MSYPRLCLAFLGASGAFLASSFVLLHIIPSMTIYFLTYPPIYLAQEDRLKFMPSNLIFILLCILAATTFYANVAPTSERHGNGLSFGTLLGIVAVITYLAQNHRFNAPASVPSFDCLTYFLQWFTVGVATSLVYRPRQSQSYR